MGSTSKASGKTVLGDFVPLYEAIQMLDACVRLWISESMDLEVHESCRTHAEAIDVLIQYVHNNNMTTTLETLRF